MNYLLIAGHDTYDVERKHLCGPNHATALGKSLECLALHFPEELRQGNRIARAQICTVNHHLLKVTG